MGDFWDRLVQFWREFIAGNALFDLLGKTLLSLALFIIFVVLARIAKRYIIKIASRTSRNVNFSALLGNLAYAGLIIIVIITILTIYTGTGLGTLVNIIGFLGIALSLSLQDVLKNFVAGIYILLEQPFKIGDQIKVKDMEGKVESIEIRTTNLQTENGLQVIIPNWLVFSEIVINRSAYNRRLVTIRLTMPLGVGLTETTKKVSEILKEFSDEEILSKPAPTVLLENTLDGKLTARLEFWTPKPTPQIIGSTVANKIKRMYPEANITVV